MKHSSFLSLCALMLVTAASGQSSDSKPPDVVVDSAFEQPEHQTTAEELSRKVKSFACEPNAASRTGNAYRRFESPRTVAESMGKRVDTIRVIGFAPKFSNQKFSQLRETLLSVWNGRFQSSTCFIDWAEGNFWFVEAQLEFENAKQGVLITDGGHVVLKETSGRVWFFRLLPAAQ